MLLFCNFEELKQQRQEASNPDAAEINMELTVVFKKLLQIMRMHVTESESKFETNILMLHHSVDLQPSSDQ